MKMIQREFIMPRYPHLHFGSFGLRVYRNETDAGIAWSFIIKT